MQNVKKQIKFNIISNPEFLSEGTAVENFLHPQRIIAGVENEESKNVIKTLYLPFLKNESLIKFMDPTSAELTKYASNCMLASRISFINEISQICEITGANINDVVEGMSLDSRIGNKFISPSLGYGGSCFPKDISSLIYTMNEQGYNPKMLNAIKDINESQKNNFLNRILNKFNNNISGRVFAMWGLSFKPSTDDVRCSAAIRIATELICKNAKIKAYDPKASTNIDGLKMLDDKYDVLVDADALIITTDWDEFANADLGKIKKHYQLLLFLMVEIFLITPRWIKVASNIIKSE